MNSFEHYCEKLKKNFKNNHIKQNIRSRKINFACEIIGSVENTGQDREACL